MIDLDAACVLLDNDHHESDFFAGLKFSSGVGPPEMIFEMTEEEKEQYFEYFQHLEMNDLDLWKKI